MNPRVLRGVFELFGGSASVFGGWLGYQIGLDALSNCNAYINLNGNCPNPEMFAVVGAVPGFLAAAIAFITGLFK